MSQSTEPTSSPAPANGWVSINIGYSDAWLLPLEDGLKFIESIKKARLFKESYNETPQISTLPPVQFKFITQEQMDAWNIQEILTL